MIINKAPFESSVIPVQCVFSLINFCPMADVAVSKQLVKNEVDSVCQHFHQRPATSQMHPKAIVAVIIFLYSPEATVTIRQSWMTVAKCL